MPPHQNRSKRSPSPTANPKPAEIRAAREAAGLTQSEAAVLVHVSLRAWQRYEEGSEDGTKRMHPAMWELFLIKLDRRAADATLASIPTLQPEGGGSQEG